MEQDKLNYIAYASIAVILISLVSIGFGINGRATSTAIVNVTITSSVAINFTTDSVDFGSGFVWANATTEGANLSTEGLRINGTWGITSTPLVLVNEGNVDVNLTLESDVAADAFLGGTNPTFEYKVENNTAGACQAQDSGGTYTAFTTSPVLTCGNITSTSNVLDIQIFLHIPADSSPTAKGATITATAEAI